MKIKTMRILSYYHSISTTALFLLCALTLTLSSCNDDDEESFIGLAISEETLHFTADGGSYVIGLTAGEEWTVASDREWCLVSPANGNGSTLCEIRVDSSYLYKERDAHLTFRCGNYSKQLTINQLGYEKVIKLSKEEIQVSDFTDYDKMFEEIDVVANVKYDIDVEYEDPAQTDWVKVKKTNPSVESIPRATKVRIDYDMYTSSDKDRVATLVFRQTDTEVGEEAVVSRLTLRQTKAQEIIPSRQGDSLALLAVTRIMHCYVNWDTSQPMIHWPNITMEEVEYTNQEGKKVEELRVTGAQFIVFSTTKSIPYQIRKLDQLRTLIFTGNENAHLKNIKLEDDVTYLPHLKSLGLLGYGICELPERMKEMTQLEELELSGNHLTEIPLDIITALDKHKLEYLNLSGNRIKDVFGRLNENAAVKDTLGLHGSIPKELFQLKNIKYLYLSYNYFEGTLPDMDYDASQYATLEEKIEHNPILPQMEQLSLNLNFFTGRIPDWILYHKHLKCWNPYTLIFNQMDNGKDSSGKPVGFSNEPSSISQPCTLIVLDEDEEEEDLTRANSFNANFRHAMEFDASTHRYPILSLKGGWHVNYTPMQPIK